MRQGISMVMRHGRWVETSDQVERAEVFGRLDGVIDAMCLVEKSGSIAEALEHLRGLEQRYADMYDGRIPGSDDTDPAAIDIEIVN